MRAASAWSRMDWSIALLDGLTEWDAATLAPPDAIPPPPPPPPPNPAPRRVVTATPAEGGLLISNRFLPANTSVVTLDPFLVKQLLCGDKNGETAKDEKTKKKWEWKVHSTA